MLRTLTTAVLGATAMTVTTILPAQAAEEYRGHWALDDPSASTASDSSGFGNTGLGIGTTPAPTGGGFTFDGISARVIVADSPTLDPGAEDTSWGVTLEMARPPAADETYDVLRKGLATTKGGDYKLEVKNVRARRSHAAPRESSEPAPSRSTERSSRRRARRRTWPPAAGTR